MPSYVCIHYIYCSVLVTKIYYCTVNMDRYDHIKPQTHYSFTKL